MEDRKTKIKDFLKGLLCAAAVVIVCILFIVLEVVTDGKISLDKFLLVIQLILGMTLIIGAIVLSVRNIVYRQRGRKGEGMSWQKGIFNAVCIFSMLEFGVWIFAGGINEYAVKAGLSVKVERVTEDIMYIVLLLILPAVGGTIIAVGAFKNRMRVSSHKEESRIRVIQGRVVSHEEVSSVLGKRLRPVLKYSVNGLECLFTVKHGYKVGKAPEIGELIDIYYSPEMEKAITQVEKKDNIRLVALGVVVLAAGVLVFIYNYV